MILAAGLQRRPRVRNLAAIGGGIRPSFLNSLPAQGHDRILGAEASGRGVITTTRCRQIDRRNRMGDEDDCLAANWRHSERQVVVEPER